MSETKLKPCPFCGSEAHIEERKMVRIWYEVRCDNCDAGTGIWKTPDEAIKAWNTRSQRVKENLKLKPCPFCGHQPEKTVFSNGVVLSCRIGCYAKTGLYRNAKEAIAAWNRRV